MNTASTPLPSLRRNISWTFLGNVVYAACQWCVVVVLARMGNTSVVGQFALALAVTTPVIMLASMQLRWVQATDSHREFHFRDCLTLRLLCLSLGLLALIAITRIVNYDADTTRIIMAIAAAKTVEAVCDVIYGWYQQHERMELIAWSLMVRGPVSVVAVAIGYWFGGLLTACIAMGVAWLAILFLFDVPQCVSFSRKIANYENAKGTPEQRRARVLIPRLSQMWNPGQLRTIFLRALPVGLTAGVYALLVNIPRYYVEEHFGSDELGVFAAMAYVLMAAETFVRAVNQSAMPRLSFFLKESNVTGFRDVLKMLTGLGFACGVAATVGAWLFGSFFLRHVYGPEYATSPNVLTLMVAGAAISFVLRPAEVGLRSMRRFTVLLGVNAASLPLLLVMTWWAVPRYGLWGAAIAMLIQIVVHGVATLGVFAVLAPRYIRKQDSLSKPSLAGPHFISNATHSATTTTSPSN